MNTAEITIVQAAQRLGLGWHRTWGLVLRGEISGRQLPTGRWLVSKESVERLAAERGRTRAAAA